jgi:pimeloyl-ACP methyl ester carboxylesterase
MAPPPVLLVHGFASSFQRNWQEPGWVDILADEGRAVIGVDFPGHGPADKPHDPAAYAHLEQVVLDVLPAHGQVDAVGFSMGAQQLLKAAASQPDRFRRVVVGGVGANLFRTADPEVVARAVEGDDGGEEIPAVAVALAHFARSSDNDPHALAACLRRPEEPLTAEQLKAVQIPVLVVLGDRDFAGPADPLVEALPDARLVTLRGTDHFGTPKDFRFIEATIDFLRD